MKNILKSVLALSLACIILLALVSCGDKSGAIKKAFEKNEYTVTTVKADDANIQSLLKLLLTEEQIKKVNEYELIFCSKNLLKGALIIKVPSSSDMKDFLSEEKDGKKTYDTYNKASENGWINGNCLILTLDGDAKEIFKKA